MEAITLATIVVTILAIGLSFAWSEDAASPSGDGMIMDCLLLAVRLWPITMPLWLAYIPSAMPTRSRSGR